jgi:hypothetical protein
MLHGKGSHATEDCHKLKDSVKKLKSNGNGNRNKSNKSNSDKKSSWKDRANNATTVTKNDLAVMVKEAVATASKKTDKKRKASSNDFNVVEALKDFNYEDEMKALNLSDDEDSSVGEVSC